MDGFFLNISEGLHFLLATFNGKALAVAGTVSTRDLALLSWIGMAVALVFAFKKTREPAFQVVKAALRKKLVSVCFAILAYTGGSLYLLEQLGIFTVYQLKYAFIWIVSVGFIPLGKMKEFQKNMVGNAFTLVRSGWTWLALFSFFLGLYPFDFLVEFFIGVPLMLFFGIILAYAEKMEEQRVVKMTSFMILGIVLFVVVRTGFDMYSNPKAYFNQQVLLNYVSVASLTVLYVPFVFALTMFCAYESVFVLVDFHVKKRSVALYAKVVSFIVFNFNVNIAKRWSWIVACTRPQNISGINSGIKRIMQTWLSEIFPEPVSGNEGWLPKDARHFLDDYELIPDYYDWRYGDYCSASATATANDINIMNTYCYSIRGVKGVVKKLVFKMSVLNIARHPERSETKGQVVNDFLAMCNMLWFRANGVDLPGSVIDSIRSCFKSEFSLGEIHGQFECVSLENGCEMIFVVQQGQWDENCTEIVFS
ncbi:hypothetical protein RVX_R17440 [Nitratidesulfovibrio sp. HK-II]|uniref:hypothetical protein n=1 Tax=Nitratidesulfovibrio sp. HK-II TaxID=2009266 RepID=UPI0011C03280|nr:hypothetical protein [Nitratidesulfovibrio sp. HK-II]